VQIENKLELTAFKQLQLIVTTYLLWEAIKGETIFTSHLLRIGLHNLKVPQIITNFKEFRMNLDTILPENFDQFYIFSLFKNK
jgi:hypothetical protein